MASAWEDCPPGSILGELVFRKGEKGKGPNLKKIKPSLEVDVDPNVANGSFGNGGPTSSSQQQQQLPLHYSLQAMTKKLPTLHPFSRNANGSVKIHGKVSRTANLQVVQDAKYRALCKSRILSTTVHNQRFVKPVDSNQVLFLLIVSCFMCSLFELNPTSFCAFKLIVIVFYFQSIFQVVQQSKSTGANTNKNKHMSTASNSTAKQGFGDAVHLFGKRLMESQQQQAAAYKLALSTGQGRNGNKRRRFAPEEPVKSIIFQLYEDKPYWTTKDLRAAS